MQTPILVDFLELGVSELNEDFGGDRRCVKDIDRGCRNSNQAE